MTRTEVHGFIEDLAPVGRLAAALGTPDSLIALHEFPDGEVLPTVPICDGDTILFYRSLHHMNERLLPLLLTADAYRRAGASRVVLVAPYLGYLRQDAVFRPGQSLSRDVMGRLIGGAFDRVVTAQAHLHRTSSLTKVFGVRGDSLPVAAALASIATDEPRSLVVGPDVESGPWVREAAERLNSDWLTFEKQRLDDRTVILTLSAPERIAGRPVLLLDDVCSTGGTLIQALGRLRDAGATRVDIALAHALFDADVERRLRAAGARRIVSTDSVPHPTNALALADLLASALRNEVH